MKKLRQNSKCRQEIINNAYEGKEGIKTYDNNSLRELLNNPIIDVIWDNEDGTYQALGFRTNIKFKSTIA